MKGCMPESSCVRQRGARGCPLSRLSVVTAVHCHTWPPSRTCKANDIASSVISLVQSISTRHFWLPCLLFAI